LAAVLPNVAIGSLLRLSELLQLVFFYSLLLLDGGLICKGACKAAGALEMSVAGALFTESVAALMVFGRSRWLFAAR
jgi:hypothetical protein